MNDIVLVARGLTAAYGRREVFRDLSFHVRGGHALGVVGPSGAGKTTLLRTMAGLLTPRSGDVRIAGRPARDALAHSPVAYFAGDATLPGAVRAARWGALGAGDLVIPERRRLRMLSRGTRQLVGLRTVLSRHPLALIVLDEPWEGLDAAGARWLTDILGRKRDAGAAVVLSSHRLHDLAGLCDAYLFLLAGQAALIKAHEIAPVGPVTAALLSETLENLSRTTMLTVARP